MRLLPPLAVATHLIRPAPRPMIVPIIVPAPRPRLVNDRRLDLGLRLDVLRLDVLVFGLRLDVLVFDLRLGCNPLSPLFIGVLVFDPRPASVGNRSR